MKKDIWIKLTKRRGIVYPFTDEWVATAPTEEYYISENMDFAIRNLVDACPKVFKDCNIRVEFVPHYLH
jgi:hypothetical protein